MPLRKETAAELQAFFSDKLPATRVFRMPCRSRVVKMLRADLAATQETDAQGNITLKAIPYEDDAGRFADFHALRHTCGTWLGACGVPATTIKEIMRHGDLRTTSRYAHSQRGQEAKAVASLPDLTLPSSESQQMRATGTDGEAGEITAATRAQLTPQLTPPLTLAAFSDGHGLSATGIIGTDGLTTQGHDKALPVGTLDAEKAGLATTVIAKRRQPTVGFEPTTTGLQNRCSTIELRWR